MIENNVASWAAFVGSSWWMVSHQRRRLLGLTPRCRVTSFRWSAETNTPSRANSNNNRTVGTTTTTAADEGDDRRWNKAEIAAVRARHTSSSLSVSYQNTEPLLFVRVRRHTHRKE